MTTNVLRVREASTGDYAQLREVLVSAFHGDAKANLVDLLRDDSVVLREFFAVRATKVVGEIMLRIVVPAAVMTAFNPPAWPSVGNVNMS